MKRLVIDGVVDAESTMMVRRLISDILLHLRHAFFQVSGRHTT